MASTNVAARSIDELSLAAWFGGTLFGALTAPSAGSVPNGGHQRAAAWDAWRPVEAAAVVAQLLSGSALTIANRRRVVGQSGVGLSTVVRMAATGAATGATVLVWRAAARATADGPVNGATPAPAPSAALRWSVPLLTGALLLLDAWMGEQQRPATVAGGLVRKLF